jgi:hypothetical protein
MELDEKDIKEASKAKGPPADSSIFVFNSTSGSLTNLYFYYSPLISQMVWNSTSGNAKTGASKNLQMCWLWMKSALDGYYYIVLNLDYPNTPDNQKVWKTGAASQVTFPNVYALAAVYTPASSGKAGTYNGLTIQLACMNGEKNSAGQIYILTWDWSGEALKPDIRGLGSKAPSDMPKTAWLIPPPVTKPLYGPVELSSSGGTIAISYDLAGTNTTLLARSRNTANACLVRDRIIVASTETVPLCLKSFIQYFLAPTVSPDYLIPLPLVSRILQEAQSTLGYIPPHLQPLLLRFKDTYRKSISKEKKKALKC